MSSKTLFLCLTIAFAGFGCSENASVEVEGDAIDDTAELTEEEAAMEEGFEDGGDQ